MGPSGSWMCAVAISLAACGGAASDSAVERQEGATEGECADGADNDRDGLFDCDDDGCAGAAACDDDAVVDTDPGPGTDTEETGTTHTDDTHDTEETGDTDTEETGDTEETEPPAPTETCEASLVLQSPDRSRVMPGACQDARVDLGVEFDPDEPARVTQLDLVLDLSASAAFDCEVRMPIRGVCGHGMYVDVVGDLVTLDCAGVPNAFETEDGAEGAVQLDVVTTDAGPGDHAGEALWLTLEGTLWLRTPGGHQIGGPFRVVEPFVAPDSEEAACERTATPFASVAAGNGVSCGLDASGRTTCWGNDFHDLPALTPPDPFVEVDVASSAACGRDAAGAIACWGHPDDLLLPPAGAHQALSLGERTGCAIEAGGAITCWGEALGSRPAGGYTALSVGWGHACAISTSSELRCWGDPGYYGALDGLAGVSAVAAGGSHVCAADAAGIRCDGWPVVGLTDVPVDAPVLVDQLVAGNTHTCAREGFTGFVTCWGSAPSDGPILAAPPIAFDQLAGGAYHTCGKPRGMDGVVCWGDDDYGETWTP